MRREVRADRIVLVTTPRECEVCNHIQHVFFETTEKYDEWDCPVCEGRIEPDEIDVPEPTDTASGITESEVPQVFVTPEDSEVKQ